MVSGQEDDRDVERLPHTEGKRLDMFLGDAFFVTVRLYQQSVRDGAGGHDESPEENAFGTVICPCAKPARSNCSVLNPFAA